LKIDCTWYESLGKVVSAELLAVIDWGYCGMGFSHFIFGIHRI